MESALVVAGLLAVAALLVLARSIVRVPADSVFVIERLGRFSRVLQPGLHVAVPLIDRVSATIPTGEQRLDIPAASATTRDGTAFSITGSVTFRVVDAARAVSNVADYRTTTAQLISSLWRRAVESSDDAGTRDALKATEAAIGKAIEDWGLAVSDLSPRLTGGQRSPFAVRDRFRPPSSGSRKAYRP